MSKTCIAVGYYPNEAEAWVCNQVEDCHNHAVVFWHYGEEGRCCKDHMNNFIGAFERARQIDSYTVFYMSLRKNTALAKSIVKALRLVYDVGNE